MQLTPALHTSSTLGGTLLHLSGCFLCKAHLTAAQLADIAAGCHRCSQSPSSLQKLEWLVLKRMTRSLQLCFRCLVEAP